MANLSQFHENITLEALLTSKALRLFENICPDIQSTHFFVALRPFSCHPEAARSKGLIPRSFRAYAPQDDWMESP